MSFDDVLSLISILGTHDLIARTGDVDLISPAFWVRIPYDKAHVVQGYRSAPVISVDQLMMLSGYGSNEIGHLLRLLFEDGVIRALRNRDGTDGILLNEGFINIDRYRRALRY